MKEVVKESGFEGNAVWPLVVEGQFDIVDGQSSDIESVEEYIRSFWGTGWINTNDGKQLPVSIEGEVLFEAGIMPNELDESVPFKVGIDKPKGQSSPVAEDGKLVNYQTYVVVSIEKV